MDALAPLREMLGEERLQALIDSANTEKVRHFCDGLIAEAMPTSMKIGDRTYELVPFIREGERLLSDQEMIERAKRLNANLRKEHGEYLMDNQEDIPARLRGKVAFVFWSQEGMVDVIPWAHHAWIMNTFWNFNISNVMERWGHRVRLLRRTK